MLLNTAFADVQISSAAGLVAFENGHPECQGAQSAVGCVYEDTGTVEDGDYAIDTSQRIGYLGAAPNGTAARDVLGPLWVLPDRSVGVNASHLYVQMMLLPTVKDPVNEANETASIPGYLSWKITPENVTVWYFGVASRELEAGPREQRYTLHYSHENAPLAYDRMGPYNSFGVEWTEGFGPGLIDYCRDVAGSVGCDQAGEANTRLSDVTPSVKAGVAVYEAELATDPALLRSDRSTEPSEPGREDRDDRSTPPEVAEERRAEADPDAPPPGASPPQASRRSGPHGPPAPVDEGGRVEVAGLFEPFVIDTGGFALRMLVSMAFWVFVSSLYSRFAGKKDLLHSAVRQRIVALARADPGISSSGLAREMGMTRNAVDHHVTLLERAGVLRVVRRPKRSFIFEGTAPAAPSQLETSLARRVIQLLQATGALRRDVIHERLADVPKRSRNHVLRSLVSREVVETTQDERGRVLVRLSSPARVTASRMGGREIHV